MSNQLRDRHLLHIQSNGGGVQSTAMYLMSCNGLLPRFDYSIFIDLGNEKPGTYKAIDYMINYSAGIHQIPIIRVTAKNLLNDSLASINSKKRFVSIPFFTSGSSGIRSGMLRRQCTNEYKIRQITATIKSLYGSSGNQHLPETYIYIGISLDEAHRVSSPEPKKFTNVFPFLLYQTGFHPGNTSFPVNNVISNRMLRSDIIKWLISEGHPVPPSSSCIFCPYTSDASWLDLKTNDPASFDIACDFDDRMRDAKPGIVNDRLYLHKSGIPLRNVIFDKHAKADLFECSGNCHT